LSIIKVFRVQSKDLDDAAVIFNSYRIFYGKKSDLTLAFHFLKERLEFQESYIFLSKMDGEIVGFVQNYPFFSSVRAERLLVLNDLFVSPKARCKGVATALIRESINFARAESCSGLLLETTDDNTTAQGLYKRMGWKKEVGIKHYSFDL
tara:strand:+ start:60 stop:509 length:450 start_codon:yes stop_codon:yes gene_type:complete